MITWQRAVALSGCVLILLIFQTTFIRAQEQGGWIAPYRLSDTDADTWNNVAVVDRYGFAHVFWTETGFADQRQIIQYSRFDGETWSTPIDIFATPSGGSIGKLSAAVDQDDILHLVWNGGTRSGPIYYSYAPAYDAATAQNWSNPVRLDIPADGLSLQVDSKGVIHIIYSQFYSQPGVYYVKSEDEGATWSDPIWFDPDILPGYVPNSVYLKLKLDKTTDGLHVIWFYSSVVDNRDDWIRYAHSLDGGKTWSEPFTIDEDTEGTNRLYFAGPIMAVHQQTVHVVWAGGDLTYRNHRFSTDAGQTWSFAARISAFGNLNGQAGDDLAIDGAGRVHYFGQIRYPQGIWHAYWDNNNWSRPELIYLIARTSSEPRGDRIHAHYLSAGVRAGNQLVVTFHPPTTDEDHSMYVMYHTLNDIPPLALKPTPTPSPTAHPTLTPTPAVPLQPVTLVPTRPAVLQFDPDASVASANGSAPGTALWLALIPTSLLIGSVVIFQLFRKR